MTLSWRVTGRKGIDSLVNYQATSSTLVHWQLGCSSFPVLQGLLKQIDSGQRPNPFPQANGVQESTEKQRHEGIGRSFCTWCNQVRINLLIGRASLYA